MRTINTKIFGSTFIGGQKYFPLLNQGDKLEFEYDNNPHHKKSILLTIRGNKLGYIKRNLADEIFGKVTEVKVKEVKEKDGLYGVNLEVKID